MNIFSSKWLLLLTLLALSGPAFAQQKAGFFTDSKDIGTGVKTGTTTYRAATRQYVLTGAGSNIWGDHDEFRYAYRRLKGDFLLYARAEFADRAGAAPHRKLGWMVRKSFDGNSPHVSVAAHGDGLTSLQFRKTAGAATEEIQAKVTHADVIQLERKGQTYTMRVAKFGQPFVTEQVATIDLGDEVYVGFFVCSHDAAALETGIFRDVRLVVPAPENMVPYQSYLGSSVEVLDVATGSREVVYTSPKSLQAPNWQHDGKSLIYNSEGLMYRLNLATRQAAVLPTGEVRNNNNDHVLSFDGKMLGLSSEVSSLGGSIVYTVPVGGGTPRQITATGPSYLHGWSPDGEKPALYRAAK